MEPDTKDYVINLRVSKETYEKIKNKAKKNGSTLSSLLRNIIDDSAEIFSDLSHDLKGEQKRGKFSEVITYHRATLAQARDCDNCATEMLKGSITTIGETDKGKVYYFCTLCK